MILKLYSKVMHKSDHTTTAPLVVNDPLSQLREVEGMLLLMLETREYIESGGNTSETYKRFLDAEKSVEKNRKQIRYERKRRQETELLLAR